jgi:dTMP kinase
MNEARKKGSMIVLDGMDGAGKGVQTQRLVAALRGAGFDVVATREPGGAPGAEAIRRLLVEGAPERWDAITELLLMYAARRDHLIDTVWPALERGAWVVSDRFSDASLAFQGIAGSAGRENVRRIHEVAVGDFKPDLTLTLDLEPGIALARAAARGGGEDRFERKGMAYHARVRAAFQEIALGDPDGHVMVDAGQDMDQVTRAVLTAVQERLKIPFQTRIG